MNVSEMEDHADDNSDGLDDEGVQSSRPITVTCGGDSQRLDAGMKLNKEEMELARRIKASVMAGEEIEPLSDMMYGQLAIMALLRQNRPLDMASLLDQVHRLQCVREEYRISESCSKGCQALERYITIHRRPDLVLHFGYTANLGTHTLVLDFTTFDAMMLSDSQKTDTWMAAMYYIFHAAYPNFDAMRKGLNIFVECEGYEMRSNDMFNLKAYEVWSGLASNYPCNIASFRHYHSGLQINILLSQARKLLPQRIHQNFDVGCRLDVRLDQALLIPTVKEVMRTTLDLLKDNLRRRYENEATFVLS